MRILEEIKDGEETSAKRFFNFLLNVVVQLGLFVGGHLWIFLKNPKKFFAKKQSF